MEHQNFNNSLPKARFPEINTTSDEPIFDQSTNKKPIKRRRTIKSCEQCRQKKLKCDKARPQCSNCLKHQALQSTQEPLDPCIYHEATIQTNIPEINTKISELKNQLSILKQKRLSALKTLNSDDPYIQSGQAQRISDVLEEMLSPMYSLRSTSPMNFDISSLSGSDVSTVQLPPSSTFSNNTMNRSLLIGSVISTLTYVKSNDPFYKSILENCESENSIKTLCIHEISKRRTTKFSTALLESERIKRGLSLYDLIKPHLLDFNKVNSLIQHFFNSGLYSMYSFLDKKEFFLKFYEFYGNIYTADNNHLSTSTRIIPDSVKQVDYIFLGQLLIMLGISTGSFYNGGELLPHTAIGGGAHDDVVPLARLCLREIDRSLMGKNIVSYIQLLLLLNYYLLHSPGYGANSPQNVQFDITRLFKLCLGVRFNVDPGQNVPSQQANLIRKIWFHVKELSYMKFIYEGDPFLVNVEKGCTTQLPKLELAEDEHEREVIKNIHIRSKYHYIFHNAYLLVSNVISPAPLEELYGFLEVLKNEIDGIDLSGMLKTTATNPNDKLAKMVKFSTVLDLYTLYIALSVPLFYSYRSLNNVFKSQEILLAITRLTSSLLILNYFIDPNQLSIKFNLHSQFGYSFHLISRLLETFFRMINIQTLLLSRVCYYETFCTNKYIISFHKVRDVLFKNLKVLLFNIDKMMPKLCTVAQETHLLNVFKVIKNFGRGEKCHVSESYLNLLQHNEQLRKSSQLDESVCKFIVNSLCGFDAADCLKQSLLDGMQHQSYLDELNSSDTKIDLYFENVGKFDNTSIEQGNIFVKTDTNFSTNGLNMAVQEVNMLNMNLPNPSNMNMIPIDGINNQGINLNTGFLDGLTVLAPPSFSPTTSYNANNNIRDVGGIVNIDGSLNRNLTGSISVTNNVNQGPALDQMIHIDMIHSGTMELGNYNNGYPIDDKNIGNGNRN